MSNLFSRATCSRFMSAGCALLAVLAMAGCSNTATTKKTAAPWVFAVSGDSRNCGNVVMPAIAEGAKNDHAAFYWHLGDLRAIYKIDEDFAAEARFQPPATAPTREQYLAQAWPDFIQHQVTIFGAMPFFLGIGNHETIAPKDVGQFRNAFATLLDRPELHRQREKDAANAAIPRTESNQSYFHWTQGGVDFINLDNATGNAFDAAQLAWFDAVLGADLAADDVRSVVVGMHEALPYSKSDSHSMCASPEGVRSGVHVYAKLTEARRHKPVYLLASHSHYYLANLYDTPHWRNDPSNGAVLPGWIVGTAGAVRYALPPNTPPGADAKEKVYGYLIGRVAGDGQIDFTFRTVAPDELLRLRGEYAPSTVAACIEQNSQVEAMHSAASKPSGCD